jgi:bla regulator protein blaR1
MATIDGLILTFALNALWQIPVAVLAGVLGDRLLRRAPARLRHALWLAVLAACLFLPAAGLLRSEGSAASRTSSTAAPAAPSAAEQSWPGWIDWLGIGSRRPAAVSTGAAAAVVWLYGLSLLVHGVRLGRAWRAARRLALEAQPLEIPESVVARCRAIIGAGGAGAVEILGSSKIGGPVTVGALRPAILLPCRFFADASPEEAVAALGHEMTHVRRRDYAVNLLCESLLLPVAFHPAVRAVRRRLAETREMACDEAVLETRIGRRQYARSLLSLAASAAGLARPSTTLGVLDAHTLEVRMKRILDMGPRASARRSWVLLGAALLLLAGIGTAVSVFAVEAVAAGTGDLKPFVGAWSGDWPAVEGRPRLRALDLEVRPNGEIVQTWYRYQEAADGSTQVDKVARPALSYRVYGNTLTFKVRIEDFKAGNRPPAPAELLGSLELKGGDDAVFTILGHSYFDAAKERREPVPPPPPPIPMKRGS